MTEQQIHAVTGAFGYSGKYITYRLLDKGHKVITLTNSLNRPNPFGDKVRAYPFNFDNPDELAVNLSGVKILYNTYWVRFNHRMFKHSEAVENTKILFNAAKDAEVDRVVHISITNPSVDSHLEYFSGKAKLETALKDSGLSHAILRPAVIFGKEDILINNIAWALRKLPIFGIFGNGEYRLQPIYVDDLAKLAVEQGENTKNVIIDTRGPETFTYKDLVRTIGKLIGKNRPLISVPPSIGYIAGLFLGWLVGDVVITRDEIDGLMADLLYVDSPPAGSTKLTDWVIKHADSLGRNYTSELSRRTERKKAYRSN